MFLDFISECMSRGCARSADEQCQGYCLQCFDKNVVKYQQSQQNQWQQDQQRNKLNKQEDNKK